MSEATNLRFSGPGAFLVGEEEEREVLDVIRSGNLSRYATDGRPGVPGKVRTLETEFAQVMGTRHALAVNSGTSALIASFRAADIGPGCDVLVPGYTFVASMSAVIAVGARPVLVEIDESLTMDPADLERACTPETRAIVPVAMLGNPADMDPIMAFAESRDLIVFEDACQAVGASYRGRRVGSIGTVGAYSLNNYKVINTGDGGMIVTNSDELYNRAFAYHDQGHKPLRLGTEVGAREVVGVNMRMNELSGAFALAQLRKLDTILLALRERKARLKTIIEAAAIPGVGFRTINDPDECATLLTLLFADADTAAAAATALQTKTLDASGWHVYNNMEQMLEYRIDGKPLFYQHDLPRTDDILARAVNLSVGVVDSGLGADRGVNVTTALGEVDRIGEEIVAQLAKALVET